MRIDDLDTLNDIRETGLTKLLHSGPRIGVGMGTCGLGNGAQAVYDALRTALDEKGVEAHLGPVGCFGYCAMEPLVNVYIPGQPMVILSRVTPDDAYYIVDQVAAGRLPTLMALCRIDEWDHLTGHIKYGRPSKARKHAQMRRVMDHMTGDNDYEEELENVPLWDELPFFTGQKKVVLRNAGLINPEDIEEYIAVGGYFSLWNALNMPEKDKIIDEVKKSELGGRGGAGYPTGVKWAMLQKAQGDQKYMICNADEGDPGAYMNRNEIESDPHMLLEGMLIGAYATGATEGIIYVRHEYPLAVRRLEKAAAAARRAGLLGEDILGMPFEFNVRTLEGAGAFVCGEETAMIASLEGRAGRPRPRPPFPAQSGLWGRPTNINNVETFCNIPVIIARGGAWFNDIGSRDSAGTKVFSLVGKVRNTGLVELPLGTPLKDIIYGIGGGSPGGRPIKAIQTGGPSGGCIPAEHFDTPVDYDSLSELGAIMGSGGMVVMDEDNCMVDVARYFLEFTHSESCGKCIPCRAGLDESVRLLRRICNGEADESDMVELERLVPMIRDMSLCGLGQTAPNPVETTLRYFRDEYEVHIRRRRCMASVCEKLYLSPCENSCPLNMRIPGYLQLVKEDRLEEAAEMIWLDNPLPASTGRICQHPCENRCRRADEDAPVNMREVHRYVADVAFSGDMLERVKTRLKQGKLKPSGKKVAVVGAGPSGLCAAFYLSMMGHEVMVYEEREKPGGMLRYSLPDYRLPKDMIDAELGVLEHIGVKFTCGQRLGAGLAADRLTKEYDSVFLATGTWNETSVGIPGEDASDVWHAIAFLEQVNRGNPPLMGERVVVIGGGNAAVDAARTATRLGAKVTIAYRRDRGDMPAIVEEVEDAEAEGVELIFFASPQRVIFDELGRVSGMEVRKTKPGEFDTSGRRTPVSTDEFYTLPCNSVIMAVGEKPDADPMRRAGIQVRRNFTVAVNPATYETNVRNVYAGGDLVTGASNISATMSTGKSAARAMDRVLSGEDRMNVILKTFTYENVAPKQPEGGPRNTCPHLDPQKRRDNFDEVMLGFDAETALLESQRCLRCDVKE
ncbi:MAG: FAD-dependent oxidoreductase [Candidatus Hydrogenedentota bacterium]